MMVAYALLGLNTGLLIFLLVAVNNLRRDLVGLQSDVSAIRKTFVPPAATSMLSGRAAAAMVGARIPPSPADLAAAIARAPTLQGLGAGPNQVDTSGVAHIGGPPQT